MPYSVFDYFYKPKVNQYAGMKPEDVPYDYKGDPTQLVNQPFARPSFFNYLLAPESAGRTSAINQQFATQPLENSNALAQADRMRQAQAQFADSRRPITLKQQAEDITNSLKTGAIFSDSRFPVELEQEKTRQVQGLQTGANFADSRAPIILDQNLKERAAYAGQDFERYQKEAATRAQIDADRQAEIAKATSKVQADLKKTESDAQEAEYVTNIAMLRSSGALPPELAKFDDNVLAKMLKGNLDSANLAQEATSRASINAGLPTLGAQVQKFRGVHGMGHGDVFGSPLLPTLDQSTEQVNYDRNPAYQMSPSEQIMQSFDGPLETAAQGAGIPRLSPSILSGGRPITQQVGGPARLTPNQPQRLPQVKFADSPVDESAEYPAMTKEDALEQLGVTLDSSGQLIVPERKAKTAFGRSALFGVDKYTDEEKATLQEKVNKILSNPRIPFRQKKVQ